jgi:hypothetical protein
VQDECSGLSLSIDDERYLGVDFLEERLGKGTGTEPRDAARSGLERRA